tara:strand:- start:3057 stop:3419 length:363 start_codon:yes stop_codon:yes gene_type:complete
MARDVMTMTLPVGAPVSELDYLGVDGGRIAAAAGVAAAATFAFLMVFVKIAVRWIIKGYDQQIQLLKTQNVKCEEDNKELKGRVKQLETLLLMHGPGPLRQELQAAISERRIADDSKGGM